MCFIPTRSLWGPLSTEFQFQVTLDLQFVQPSWCLLVRTKYLEKTKQTTKKRTFVGIGRNVPVSLSKGHLDILRAAICDIKTWVNWRNNVDMLCSTSFSLLLSMLALNLDKSTEKPLQNNIGRERETDTVYQSSVTQVECPSFLFYLSLVFLCSVTKQKCLLRRLQRFPLDIFRWLICPKM